MKRLFLFHLLLIFSLGISAQTFVGLSDSIEQGDFGNLKAVVISHHGEVIYEDYFRGTQADDLHLLNSVTKSVGSALIGIAHRQGKIQLDQDLNYFYNGDYPMSRLGYRDKRFITVEAVLQQRHGIYWDEWTLDYRDPANPSYEMIVSSDWYQYVLTRLTDAQPGEKFAYSTGASNLMGGMIRKLSGTSPRNFAMKELFSPLGVQNIHWEGYSENGRGHGMTQWPNPYNDEPLGYGLWLKPRDMIKFGELYLNGGVYNGRRIIDQSWIDASWTTYSNSDNTKLFADNPGSGYGYQWWIQKLTDDLDRSWSNYYASGWGRQHILVFPELDLVVASVADDYDYDGPGIGAIMRSVVLPQLNPALDQRFNGAWYDPTTDGQGFTLEILDDGNRLIAFWYTYGENDSKRWFTMSGPITGSEADVVIIETSNGEFLKGDAVELSDWGTGQFSVVDCNHMDFKIESEEITTVVPLTRLTGNCASYR
jgi:CubicO group peptidase (beta-lactamase class C family)